MNQTPNTTTSAAIGWNGEMSPMRVAVLLVGWTMILSFVFCGIFATVTHTDQYGAWFVGAAISSVVTALMVCYLPDIPTNKS